MWKTPENCTIGSPRPPGPAEGSTLTHTIQLLVRTSQQQPDPIPQNRRTTPADLLLNLSRRVPAAEVGEHDQPVLEALRYLDQIVEMDVPVTSGPLLMAVHHERAFDEQDVGLEQRLLRGEDLPIGVSRIEKKRQPKLFGDHLPCSGPGGDLLFLLTLEPSSQPVPHLEHLVCVRRHAVRRAMDAHLMSLLHADHVAFAQPHNLHLVEGCASEPSVNGEQLPEISGRLGGNVDLSSWQPLQMPLPGVKRQPHTVVEMCVGEEDLRNAHQHIRTAADVEPDVPLRDAKPGLVPCARASLDAERSGVYGDGFVSAHAEAWEEAVRPGQAERQPEPARTSNRGTKVRGLPRRRDLLRDLLQKPLRQSVA